MLSVSFVRDEFLAGNVAEQVSPNLKPANTDGIGMENWQLISCWAGLCCSCQFSPHHPYISLKWKVKRIQLVQGSHMKKKLYFIILSFFVEVLRINFTVFQLGKQYPCTQGKLVKCSGQKKVSNFKDNILFSPSKLISLLDNHHCTSRFCKALFFLPRMLTAMIFAHKQEK